MKIASLGLSIFFVSHVIAQQPVSQWINRSNGLGDYSDKFNCVATDATGNSYMAGYTVQTGNRMDYLTVKLNNLGDTLWTATFNGTDSKDDEVLAMTLDAAGNTYVTGYSKDAQFNDDIVTIKYDPNGAVLWTRTYNNTTSNQDDQGNAICLDLSGNVIVAGQTDIDPSAASDDAFMILSYSSAGVLNWTYQHDVWITDRANKVLAGTSGIYIAGRTDNGNDDDVTVLKLSSAGTLLWNLPIDIVGLNDRPADMRLDASENVLVCGRTDNGNDDDLLLLKINSAGSLLWQNTYSGSAMGNDRAAAMTLDASGNIYITGKTDIDPSVTVTNYDYCTLKFNSSGIQQWVQTLNGSANLTDEANAICLVSNGNIVVTGHSDESSNPLVTNYAVRTICYNASGVQQWNQVYQGTGNKDENGNAIASLTGGSVIIAGTIQDVQAQSDAIGLTYNQSGALGWQKSYHGLGDNSDNVNAIAADASGNSYLAGYMYSQKDLKDMCVIKLNALGDTLWVRTYNGSDNGNDEANDLKIDNSGNVYVTGYTKESATDYDITTLKYSPTGALVWATSFDNVAVSGEDKGAKLLLDASSNIYVSGYVDRDATASLNEDVVLLKYNNLGTLQWSKQYNGTGNGKDVPNGMIYLNSAKIVVSGSTFNGTDQDALTLEFSASGTQLWAKSYDGGNGDEKTTGIVSDASENIYIAGRTFNGTDNDLLCVQYSVSGTQNWVYTLDGGNGDDEINAITTDTYGGLYLAGNSSNGNNSDVILVRLANTGSELWHQTLDGQGQLNDLATSLFFDANNYIVVAGETENVGNAGLIYNDFLLTKFTESGDVVWSVTYDSGEQFSDGINAMTFDNSGNIYVTGNSFINASQKDILTIKYDSPLGIEDKEPGNQMGLLYPNPTHGMMSINLPESEGVWQITISDMIGNEVYNFDFNENLNSFDVTSFTSGTYLLTAVQNRNKICIPFIKK